MQRLARWTWAAIVGLPLLIGASALAEPAEPPPPGRAEAEAVLDEVVRLAGHGDLTRLCESDVVFPGTCRWLVDGARDAGWAPGADRPEVVGTTLASRRTLILHLRGTRADGSAFTSDFAVDRDADRVRGTTPVYWSGVRVPG
ncbi:hypothetical protein FHS29_002649 [Saccharothrix tamanrassetensis]|uniref:Uncharacterized protein n=1 Tax=Saccharothrix tamanrassetensis TaxID=1051531 RepID=A0A841CGD8_9PSEU|nr:hypothetical protein [Saccharothrix tamanrassetensis]MBB5956063.1 hypothetical protein [Saccharothrix tamanrassetensis]